MPDISKINNSFPINNKTAVASATKTGAYAKRVVRADFPLDLTIESIESKFSHRFDDPSYYYGNGTQGT